MPKTYHIIRMLYGTVYLGTLLLQTGKLAWSKIHYMYLVIVIQ